MASDDGWDPEAMFLLYLHDYMVKKKMFTAAAILKKEANICDHSVVINTPEGFLLEWWSIVHDVHAYRQREHQGDKAETSFQAMQMNKEIEQQNNHYILPPFVTNHQSFEQFPSGANFENIYEETFGQSAIDLDPISPPIDANNINFSKSPNSASLSPLPPQIFKLPEQGAVRLDKTNGIGFRKAAPMDPMLNVNGLRTDKLPVSELLDHAGMMSKGVNPVPLNRLPVNAPNNQQQFQMMAAEYDQQQLLLSQELMSRKLGKQTFEPGTSPIFHSSNPMFDHSESKGEDEEMSMKFKEHLTKVLRDQPQQHLLDNARRKKATPLRIGENPMECVKAKEDKSVVENVESYFSHDIDNDRSTNTPFSVLKGHSAGYAEHEHQGFTFSEVGCLHSSKSKVFCCHFSSDGKLLASAGHDKKVFIWNVETFDSVSTSEGHLLLITDVRFQPCSTIFATSSFDRTVKIWDAARPSKSLFNLLGHAEQVISLDFHPRKFDLLCSCDINDEIRLWNVNKATCTRVSKGATRQVRFEPHSGKLLATASGNQVSLFDVETGSHQLSWKGHVKDVVSVCWDYTGKYVLSVSEESARIWSTVSGKGIYELQANGNKFQSCTFHPGYDHLWILGGYQSLELWNPDCQGTLSIPAHNGLVAALAVSRQTRTVASASHDQCVKLWK